MNIIILCGGSGTRLWPLSRSKLPKQFLCLTNEKSMFQNTILRFNDFIPEYDWYTPVEINKYIIICNKEHVFIVEQQLKELNINKEYIIVTEPIARDTAPAIAIGSLCGGIDDLSLVVPCDHIFNDSELCNVITMGANGYSENSIVTFGIKPKYPETGYGYIEVDNDYKTIEFTEKPDLETAKMYFANGKHVWNSGIFMFHNKDMLSCFEKYQKEMLDICFETFKFSKIMNNILNLNKEHFSKLTKISIDYAIMEALIKDENSNVSAFTLPYSNHWSDIGSFNALHDECNKDENENVIKGNVVTRNTNNCYIESEKATIATIGLENIVIVNTRDALLVADKNQSQDVKKVLENFDDKDDLKIVHAKAYRPWGWYINVEGDDYSGYKVKRIGVYPGKRLSLQSHNNRSDPWVICKGKARVQLDDDYIEMGPNEHVFIPVKSLHRMENIGDEIVEFVETQIGEYLGEDDIVRYEDDFGRA